MLHCVTAFTCFCPFHAIPTSIYIKEVQNGCSQTLPVSSHQSRPIFPDYVCHILSRSKGSNVQAAALQCAAKNLKRPSTIFDLWKKIYGFLCTLLCCQYKRKKNSNHCLRTPSVSIDKTLSNIPSCRTPYPTSI